MAVHDALGSYIGQVVRFPGHASLKYNNGKQQNSDELQISEMCDTEYKSFYLWLAEFIGFLGLLALCLWLALRPKEPTCSVTFVTIDQPSDQNGTIFYSLEFENQNKDSNIYYDDSTFLFLYGQRQDKVAETTLKSFHQGTSSKRVESGTVHAKSELLKTLLSNAIKNATSELKVALRTRFHYKTWGIKSKFHGLNLATNLPIGGDGKLKFSGKKNKYKLKQCSTKKLVKSVKH
ncbi:protein NDR1 [Arachis hypogaea]